LGMTHFTCFNIECDDHIVMLHHEADHSCKSMFVFGARIAWVSAAKPDNADTMGRP